MKIGLALSGGGFRATVFHLGVLARLAEENRLEEVSFLSTVSGGSLCVGLVYAQSGFSWPSSQHLIKSVIPKAHQLLTTEGLQSPLIWRLLKMPLSLFVTRADDLAALLRERWGITATLRDLPSQPRWMINATCYETGKNWQFERFRMGDYVFGYTYDTDVPLSDALAASAGFPGPIGPLVLDTRPHAWFKYSTGGEEIALAPTAHVRRPTEPIQPRWPRVHLWDGGVYDNLGVEGLHNFITGWRRGIDFLVISDASGRSKPESYQAGPKALLRIMTGIMMDQIRSLRSRAVLERMINHNDAGAFLQIGNNCKQVLTGAGKESEVPSKCPQCLSAAEAMRAANMATVIRRLTEEEWRGCSGTDGSWPTRRCTPITATSSALSGIGVVEGEVEDAVRRSGLIPYWPAALALP